MSIESGRLLAKAWTRDAALPVVGRKAEGYYRRRGLPLL
jgi:hypothetical protein